MRFILALAALVSIATPAAAMDLRLEPLERMGVDLHLERELEPMQNHVDRRGAEERRGALRADFGRFGLSLSQGERGVGAQLVLPRLVDGWEVRAGALAGGEGGMLRFSTPFSF